MHAHFRDEYNIVIKTIRRLEAYTIRILNPCRLDRAPPGSTSISLHSVRGGNKDEYASDITLSTLLSCDEIMDIEIKTVPTEGLRI